MLFSTLVLLATKVRLLMNGVAPAVWRVIVIVVWSASLVPAKWEKTMKRAPTMINEHVFIKRLFFIGVFFEKSARACQRSPVESSKNFNETHFLRILELKRTARSRRE